MTQRKPAPKEFHTFESIAIALDWLEFGRTMRAAHFVSRLDKEHGTRPLSSAIFQLSCDGLLGHLAKGIAEECPLCDLYHRNELRSHGLMCMGTCSYSDGYVPIAPNRQFGTLW